MQPYLAPIGWFFIAAGIACAGLCWLLFHFKANDTDVRLGNASDDEGEAASFPTSLLGRNAPAPEEIGAGATSPITLSEILP